MIPIYNGNAVEYLEWFEVYEASIQGFVTEVDCLKNADLEALLRQSIIWNYLTSMRQV